MPDATSLNGEKPTLDRLIGDLNALEMLADGWDEAARNGAHARAEAVDALNKEAFRRLIGALKDLPEFSSALKEAAQDEVVYAVLRRHGILRPSLYERVEAALETVRPSLASHGGDAEVASVDGNRAEIRFLGACDGCPASQLTFYAGVKRRSRIRFPKSPRLNKRKALVVAAQKVFSLPLPSPIMVTANGHWRCRLLICLMGNPIC